MGVQSIGEEMIDVLLSPDQPGLAPAFGQNDVVSHDVLPDLRVLFVPRRHPGAAVALKLSLADLNGPRETRTLASGTLSIGRSERNDWVLPDPERHLSKTHCVISVEGSRYVLTDVSTNGVHINGARQPTTRDSRVVLTDGDEFRLGDYTVVAQEVAAGAFSGPERRDDPLGGDPLGGNPQGGNPQGGNPLGGNPFDRAESLNSAPLTGSNPNNDPLDVDPLDDPLGRPPDPSFSHPMRHVAPIQRQEDPFDRADEVRHRPKRSEDLFAGVKPAVTWQGPSQSDHADAPRHALPPSRVVAPSGAGNLDFDALDALLGDLSDLQARPGDAPGVAPVALPRPGPTDDFDDLDDLLAPVAAPTRQARGGTAQVSQAVPARPEPSGPVSRSGTAFDSDERQAFDRRAESNARDDARGNDWAQPDERPAPRSRQARRDGAERGGQGARAEAEGRPGADAAAGLAAFLQGAGVPQARVADDPQVALNHIGQVFRALTEGLRDVLMSRAAIKSELRVEQTLLKSTNNNALKFSFSPDEAVIALLNTGRPGYMAPLAATREAFDDIKRHELAVMVGVQTALVDLLKRFDPEVLESHLTQGKFANMLPATRKARLWDSFQDLYNTIALESEDDFQAVFGRAFAKAYEAQTRKN
jgi:type VI secretion system protein